MKGRQDGINGTCCTSLADERSRQTACCRATMSSRQPFWTICMSSYRRSGCKKKRKRSPESKATTAGDSIDPSETCPAQDF